MSIISAFSGIKAWVFAFYPFCYEIDHHTFRHIEFASIWWLCFVVFRLHGNNAGVSDLLFSDFLWLFFTPPTDPKPGNSFDAKRIKRGWPKPYGFFLDFINTLLLRISVILSFVLFFVLFSVFLFFVFFSFCFVLFCFVFAGEINRN